MTVPSEREFRGFGAGLFWWTWLKFLLSCRPVKPKVQILPSLLAGDFGNLAASAQRAEQAGADAIHIDIMDARFVPNLSMGPDVVRATRKAVNIPLNVHLMMSRPDLYLEQFIGAGAASLLIQVEARCNVGAALGRIRARGARPGIVLNPETPLDAALPFLDTVDEVLFMTVHPGFGGQQFMPEPLPKINALFRRMAEAGRMPGSARPAPDLMVDGGIDLETVVQVAAAGANAIVAGSSLFRAADMAVDISAMRARVEAALPDPAVG